MDWNQLLKFDENEKEKEKDDAEEKYFDAEILVYDDLEYAKYVYATSVEQH